MYQLAVFKVDSHFVRLDNVSNLPSKLYSFLVLNGVVGIIDLYFKLLKYRMGPEMTVKDFTFFFSVNYFVLKTWEINQFSVSFINLLRY